VEEDIVVSIRELKTHLSQYLQLAKDGRRVVITERGTPIARIVITGDSFEERLRIISASGQAEWSGRRFTPARPGARNRGTRTVAELLLEDRE
jgi:prevent-host-death family protein